LRHIKVSLRRSSLFFYFLTICVFVTPNQLINITMHFSTLFTSAALTVSFVAAHPGHDISEELRAREIALQSLPPNLAHCAEKLRARGITADAAKRRAFLAKIAREERGLDVGKLHGNKTNNIIDGLTSQMHRTSRAETTRLC
jgi:hypothetical protein